MHNRLPYSVILPPQSEKHLTIIASKEDGIIEQMAIHTPYTQQFRFLKIDLQH